MSSYDRVHPVNGFLQLIVELHFYYYHFFFANDPTIALFHISQRKSHWYGNNGQCENGNWRVVANSRGLVQNRRRRSETTRGGRALGARDC